MSSWRAHTSLSMGHALRCGTRRWGTHLGSRLIRLPVSLAPTRLSHNLKSQVVVFLLSVQMDVIPTKDMHHKDLMS